MVSSSLVNQEVLGLKEIKKGRKDERFFKLLEVLSLTVAGI